MSDFELLASQAHVISDNSNRTAEVSYVVACVRFSKVNERSQYVRANKFANGIAYGGELAARTPTGFAAIARRIGEEGEPGERVFQFSHGLHAIEAVLFTSPSAVDVVANFAKRANTLVPISSGLGNAALVSDEAGDVQKLRLRARLIVPLLLREIGCHTSRAGAAGIKEEVGIRAKVFVVPPPAALRGCSFGRSRRLPRWASGIGGKSTSALGQARGHNPAITIAQAAVSHVVTCPVCDEQEGQRRNDSTWDAGRHWSSSSGRMFA